MAEDTIIFLEQVVGGPARLLGVSDGAVVALMVAKKRPDLAPRLICAAGVFHCSGWVASAIDPDNEPPEFLIDSYGEVSPVGCMRLEGSTVHRQPLLRLQKTELISAFGLRVRNWPDV
jgi:pimeloyl-ACP methyl ester carboxylesterase